MGANTFDDASILIPDPSGGECIRPGGLVRVSSREYFELKLGLRREMSGAFLLSVGDGAWGLSVPGESRLERTQPATRWREGGDIENHRKCHLTALEVQFHPVISAAA